MYVPNFILWLNFVVTVLLDKEKIKKRKIVDFFGIWTQDL